MCILVMAMSCLHFIQSKNLIWRVYLSHEVWLLGLGLPGPNFILYVNFIIP